MTCFLSGLDTKLMLHDISHQQLSNEHLSLEDRGADVAAGPRASVQSWIALSLSLPLVKRVWERLLISCATLMLFGYPGY